MNPLVIGLVGKKRSGKDSVYDAIRKVYPSAVRIAFADPLKRELAEACGVTTEFMEQHKALFRLGLQWFGTEFRRELFGRDYWIKKAQSEFWKAVDTGAPVIVFTDCRFENEAALIRSMGGTIWRVVRPLGFRAWLRTLFRWSHASEREQDRIAVDRTIRNSGTLEDLRGAVRASLKL